jgi:hypothetical protein
MKARLFALLLGAATIGAPLCSEAASISATFHQLTGSQWIGDFVVTGDGSPSVINDFTIYFPDASFAALSLGAASPAGWDSLIVQPDTTLHSPGFLDSLALGSGIGTGASVSGFEVKFNFLGAGSPLPLRFDINDANFHAVYSGLTTVTAVTAVPEPEAAWLVLVGLGALAGRQIRQGRQQLRSRSAA